jgi:hypothetical protein
VRIAGVFAALLLVAAACGNDTDSAGSSTTSTSGGDASGIEEAMLTPLLMRAGPAIVPVEGSDGRYHLLWETSLQNATSLDLTVSSIEILSGGETLLALDEQAASEVVEVLGTREADSVIGAAAGATMFLTMAFDSESAIPDSIEHRVTVTAEPLPGGEAVDTGAETEVDTEHVVPVLGPPVEPGDNYIAADTCCTSTRHIRAGLPINGQLWFAQRFAVDWEEVTDDGRFVEGDPSAPESYVIYGKTAIAATDGTVVLVIDGLEDQVPGELPGTSIPLDEADGNSVVVDIGDGLYMMYAHMKNGSIKVAEGDPVSRGDEIGQIGNTGNSSAPHLHFHVMDGPSPLASNGLPYVIDSFTVTGKGESTEDFDAVENTETPLTIVSVDDEGPRTDELPLDLSIVDFG